MTSGITKGQIEDYELIARCCYPIWGVEDVERWFDFAHRKQCHPLVRPTTLQELKTFVKVPNEPFREAYIKQTKCKQDTEEVAKRVVEFLKEKEIVEKKDFKSRRFKDRETECLKEYLGIQVRTGKNVRPNVAIWMPYEIAEALCYALRLNPRKVGI